MEKVIHPKCLYFLLTSFIIISEVVALKKKYIIIISAIVCVLLLLSGFLIFRSCDKDEPNTPSLPQDSNAVDWNGQQQLPGASGQAGKICIPGFDSLVFLAGQTKQKVNFYNPAANKDRLFLMTLFIEDSVYWKSGYCPSGSGYYDIELSEPLLEGEYSGYLKIQVFKTDGTEVNGAKVAFNLLVTSEVQE